jgi:glycosyltransferase involved in cell wall biosynthesis
VTPLAVSLAMARCALALRPEVFHVFKPIGYSGLAGQWLARFARAPQALDHDDWEGRGGWADVNPYPPLWRRFFIWQEADLLRRAQAVTVASRTLQTQVWGLGVEPARVFYLPNGPDESLRARAAMSPTQRARVRAELGVGAAPLAVYMGQIPHGNDLDLALAAAQNILPRVPDLRLAILGVGGGVPALRAAIARRNLERTALLKEGWLARERALDYAAASDLAIYPYRDTLINRSKCSAKIIDYMALGLPIVASRVGQNAEYIEHGVSGWLAEPGDALSLAEGMLAALSDLPRARAMGAAAQARLWARFDWDTLVETVELAYRSVRRVESNG